MAFARIFQARLVGHIHGQQSVNVFNFGSNEAPADSAALAAILTQLATAIMQCAITQLLVGVTSDYTLETCEARQIFPTQSDPAVTSAPANTTGLTSATNVSFAAVLMNIRTGGGGRRGRGRNFLPPPADAAMTNSVLSDGTTADFYREFLQCLSEKFIGASATEEQRLGVLSRAAIAGGATFSDAFREAISLELNTQISMLRSRKVGSGS